MFMAVSHWTDKSEGATTYMYLCCRVGQGFDVTTPESLVQEGDSGRVETSQLAVDAEQWDSGVDSSKVESASDENHENCPHENCGVVERKCDWITE